MAIEEISKRFRYVPMTDHKQITSSSKIREEAMVLADMIDIYCTESRQKSIALTKLQECVFWVNDCIAKN